MTNKEILKKCLIKFKYERCIKIFEILTDFLKEFFIILMVMYCTLGLAVTQTDMSEITLSRITQTQALAIVLCSSSIMGIVVYYLLLGVKHWFRIALVGSIPIALLPMIYQLNTDWIKSMLFSRGLDVFMNLFFAIAILSVIKWIAKVVEDTIKENTALKNSQEEGALMENLKICTTIFFEIKDAEIYGGVGTVGYAAMSFTHIIKDSNSHIFKTSEYEYIRSCIKNMAGRLNIPEKNVKTISKEEYENNTEDD